VPHRSPTTAGLALAATIVAAGCVPTRPAPEPAAAALRDLAPTEANADPSPRPADAPGSDELTQLAAASAAALAELYAEGTLQPPTPATSPAAARTAADTASAGPADAHPAVPDPDPEPAPDPDPTPPPSLEERIADLAGRLAVLLRERGESRADLAAELPALAALEALDADGLGPWLDPEFGLLAPAETDTAFRLRDLQRALAERPDAPGDAIAELAAELLAARPLAIAVAELCTRVEGFGRYAPIGDPVFLAGRRHRLIVYTQIEGFTAVPLDDAGLPLSDAAGSELPASSHRVELSQELLLYHDADGLLAWRRPPQKTGYDAITPVRDFFMVDQIELPRTLTVGRYHLKVVVRDAANDAVDERIIPIRVVADPALAVR